MALRSSFGKALQQVRKIKGLTQEDFSVVSSRTYLSTLERGLKSPTLEKIEQLSTVLGIHPVSLITLAYTKGSEKNAEILFAQAIKEIRTLKGFAKTDD